MNRTIFAVQGGRQWKYQAQTVHQADETAIAVDSLEVVTQLYLDTRSYSNQHAVNISKTTYIMITRNSSRDENTRTWRISSYLFTYLRLSTNIHWTGSSPIRHKVNLTQLKTFELELNFAQYIHYTDVQIADFAGTAIYHLPSNVISVIVGFVYINLQQ